MVRRDRKRRVEPPGVRRDQILGATRELLVERGFDAITVSAVAEHAGIAKGTVYLYFNSKPALLIGLRDRYAEDLTRALQPSLTDVPKGQFAARLAEGVRTLFDAASAQSDLHHRLFHDAAVTEHDAFARPRRLFADFVRAGVEAHEFEVADAEIAAAFVLAGLQGLIVTAVHEHRDVVAPATDLTSRTLGVRVTR